MPRNARRRTPGPLDSLPRPLDERERRAQGGRGRSRFLALLGTTIVVGAVIVASGALGPAAGPAVGRVAGVVATPDPTDIGGPINPVSIEPALGAGSDPSAADPSAVPALGADPASTPSPDPPVVSIHGPDPATLSGYRWPIAKPRVTLPFGPSPWGSHLVDGQDFHDGVDLATFCGDRIVAAHAGVVIAAGRHFDGVIGWLGDLGPYTRRLDRKKLWSTLPIVVVIDDGNGYRSMYAHFGRVSVRKGQTVRAGQLLGYEGATGRASGCHLHYGLFSPLETDTFGIDPAVAKRMKLPKLVIARVDPLLVLPERRKSTRASAAPSSTSP